MYDNPQITKAQSVNFKLGIKEFSKLSMWVGISEAIRLLPIIARYLASAQEINIKYLLYYSFLLMELMSHNLGYSLLELSNYMFVYLAELAPRHDNLITFSFVCHSSLAPRLTWAQLEMKEQATLAPSTGELLVTLPSSRGVGECSKDNEENFYEWVAGIIDGDGCLLLSKKGYASLEIVTQLRDKKCLYLIKQKFGGSVKLYSGDNYLKYRLHHKEGLLKIIEKINGLLQNPTRILQLGKICEKYNIVLKDPKPLTYYNGWFAGFFDTDGSIYLNEASGQIFITATQKNRFLLEALVVLYGGQIYPMVKQEAFKWTCFKKKEVLSLVKDYFKVNPCRSQKLMRIHMVNKFFELRKLHAHNASNNTDLGKAWKHYLIKWNSLVSK